MARRCLTCDHPDRAPIEIALANGVAARVLALKYGLSEDSLTRHRAGHMEPELLQRLRVRGHRSDEELAQIRDVESKSLLDHLVWQRGLLYRNADRAREIGDLAGERAAIGEAGRTSERIGKLLGELGAHITNNVTLVNITAHPDYHRLRTAMARGLRRFPEAQADVFRELEQLEAVPMPAPALIEHQRVA